MPSPARDKATGTDQAGLVLVRAGAEVSSPPLAAPEHRRGGGVIGAHQPRPSTAGNAEAPLGPCCPGPQSLSLSSPRPQHTLSERLQVQLVWPGLAGTAIANPPASPRGVAKGHCGHRGPWGRESRAAMGPWIRCKAGTVQKVLEGAILAGRLCNAYRVLGIHPVLPQCLANQGILSAWWLHTAGG